MIQWDHSLVTALARLYPWPVDPSEELRDALIFLGWEISAEDVVRAGYGAGLVVGCLWAVLLLFVPSALRLVFAFLGAGIALLVVHVGHAVPELAATARRTSALGSAPDLVARAVLSMRLEPTPERAGEFAAQTGEGVLAQSLETHVRQTHNTAQSGLDSFGDAWAETFPSLRRAFALVVVAGRTQTADRYRLLDRALAVVLEGTSNQLQAFAAQIQTPVTALYAFGVLLPTALVALLPAAGAAGVVVTPVTVVFLYNLALPGALSVAALWLLTRRPVSFPPPEVTHSHPDVIDSRQLALVSGLVAAIATGFVTARALPEWGPPIAAAGFGCGVALVVAHQPVVSVYDLVRDAEDGLADALELVGRRVANGRAVETAIEDAARELDGTMGELLAFGVKQQRQLHVGVREAFLGRHGALATVPSPRVRGSFALLALAAHEGRPAGAALLSMAEHTDDLQRIEREARQQLAYVCRTLVNTAALFGPLVAGSTVALAEGIGGDGELLGGDQSLGWLGAPVGVYVLFLAVILTTLSVGLIRGFDRSLIGYRVGRTLVSATVVYLGSYLLVGTVL